MACACYQLVALSMMAAGCGRAGFDAMPADAAPELVETMTLPAIGTAMSSVTTLDVGVTYRLRVSGVFFISPYGDAEYLFMQPDGPAANETAWDLCGDNVTDAGLAIDDAVVNGEKFPKWGPYRADHVYQVDYLGKGAPIVANIHDSFPSNNSGSLTLEIMRL